MVRIGREVVLTLASESNAVAEPEGMDNLLDLYRAFPFFLRMYHR